MPAPDNANYPWWQRWDIEDVVRGPMGWAAEQDGLLGMGMMLPCLIWFMIGLVLWVALFVGLGISSPIWAPVVLIKRHRASHG